MSSGSIAPAPAPTAPQPASASLTLALAPYLLAGLIIAGVVVLLALGKITESAGIGLLGVIVGGHGALAIGTVMGNQSANR